MRVQLAAQCDQRRALRIDPAVYDTSPIQNDWELVSGLQDAARSIVTTPKTATEASISDQALAARVSEFRDQIEDWLTEIAHICATWAAWCRAGMPCLPNSAASAAATAESLFPGNVGARMGAELVGGNRVEVQGVARQIGGQRLS